MIAVGDSVVDIILVIAVAAIAGGIGGFAYQLLQIRGKETGAIERPHKLRGNIIDLGWIASVILGAIVAVAALYVFPPLQEVKITAANGQETTTQNYDVTKLVALSLILGSAGGTFLSALQGRVLSAINEQKAQVAATVGKAQVEQVKNNVAADTKTALQQNLLPEIAKIANQQAVSDPQKTAQMLTDQLTAQIISAVQDRGEQHTEAAQNTIDTTIAAASAP